MNHYSNFPKFVASVYSERDISKQKKEVFDDFGIYFLFYRIISNF